MANVLIVDSNTAEQQTVRELIQSSHPNWFAEVANTVSDALQMLSQAPFDALVVDLRLACENCFELLTTTQRSMPKMPVVVLAQHAEVDTLLQALQHGAATFVRKEPRELRRLADTLDSALCAARVARDRAVLLSSMESAENTFVLGNDVELLRAIQKRILDSMKLFGIANDADDMRVSLVLEEAFLNAVYHGNLELSSELKEAADGSFEELARERSSLAPWCQRRVRVTERVNRREAIIVIQDEGAGFDVSKVRDCLDEDGLTRASGRGLMLMRAFMDVVSYNETGNVLTLIKRRPEPIPMATDIEQRTVESVCVAC